MQRGGGDTRHPRHLTRRQHLVHRHHRCPFYPIIESCCTTGGYPHSPGRIAWCAQSKRQIVDPMSSNDTADGLRSNFIESVVPGASSARSSAGISSQGHIGHRNGHERTHWSSPATQTQMALRRSPYLKLTRSRTPGATDGGRRLSDRSSGSVRYSSARAQKSPHWYVRCWVCGRLIPLFRAGTCPCCLGPIKGCPRWRATHRRASPGAALVRSCPRIRRLGVRIPSGTRSGAL